MFFLNGTYCTFVGGYCDMNTNDISYLNNSGIGTIVMGSGMIYTNPLFANTTNNDFHEQSPNGRWTSSGFTNDIVTSPCIDAGDSAAGGIGTPAERRQDQYGRLWRERSRLRNRGGGDSHCLSVVTMTGAKSIAAPDRAEVGFAVSDQPTSTGPWGVMTTAVFGVLGPNHTGWATRPFSLTDTCQSFAWSHGMNCNALRPP